MRYSISCLSDTGTIRQHNEDNFAFFGHVMPAEHQTSNVLTQEAPYDQPFVVGVFDGMGGEAAGERASYVAAATLSEHSHGQVWTARALSDVLRIMDAAVCDERTKLRVSTMGATATLLAIHEGQAVVANVGDSPAMLYSQGNLKTVSHPHTDAEMMRSLGIVGRKPGLTQYLGMSDGDISISPHICDFTLLPGDSVLLASDGLVESLDEGTIAKVLASPVSTREKAMQLRDVSIENGSTDNVTVLICEVEACSEKGVMK